MDMAYGWDENKGMLQLVMLVNIPFYLDGFQKIKKIQDWSVSTLFNMDRNDYFYFTYIRKMNYFTSFQIVTFEFNVRLCFSWKVKNTPNENSKAGRK